MSTTTRIQYTLKHAGENIGSPNTQRYRNFPQPNVLITTYKNRPLRAIIKYELK